MKKEQHNATMALAASPLRLLDVDLLETILVQVSADDAFVVQLTCEPLHAIIKEIFAYNEADEGGVKTTPAGVVSSLARFELVRS